MNRQAILWTLDPNLFDILMAVAREVTQRNQKMHICERLSITKQNAVGVTIMCKTDEGYWVDWATSRKMMGAVKTYLAKDSMLEELGMISEDDTLNGYGREPNYRCRL